MLTLANYEQFFEKTQRMVGPLMATENPDLSAFRAHGGKMISWHGYNDQAIMPQGTIMYYDSVMKFSGKDYGDVQQFYRLFMAPGVEHCGGGDAPQPGRFLAPGQPWSLAVQENLFQALINWVEHGQAPDRIVASQPLAGGATRTRSLCPYPAFAKYIDKGSTDDASNFICATK